MTQIAILGFGNIGSGVAEMLKRNADYIREASGDDIAVKYVLDKRDLTGSGYEACAVGSIDDIVSDPSVSIVCEMMGGTTPAFEFSLAALKAGKSVVTSNKAVVAKHGVELLKAAKENGVQYLYEASVGGGIPILHAFDDSLKGCRIDRIDGILNGTTNYILTRMHDCGSSFEDALDEAKRLGYAEADPTADVSGADTCRKICILSALAWGKLVDSDTVYCEGITEMKEEHNAFATACGGALKLVATAKKSDDAPILSVSPCVVMEENPLSSVKGVFNAVKVLAGDMGDLMFYGMGAGKFPTAGAVISDILAILRRKDDTNGYRFFENNTCEPKAYAQTKHSYCVKAKADRALLDAMPFGYTLLKEENGDVYFLVEDITKNELDEALNGVTVSICMRAIV